MRLLVHRLVLFLAVLGLGACEGSGGPSPDVDGEPRPPRGSAWVIFDADTVVAEVADTPEARQQGLMFRESLNPGEGMLFVFETELPHAFYMRNTLIPLDIAWLNESQVIVDIQQMEPQTEDLHTPVQPALYAVEVPQGWFAEEGVEVGDLARIVFGRS